MRYTAVVEISRKSLDSKNFTSRSLHLEQSSLWGPKAEIGNNPKWTNFGKEFSSDNAGDGPISPNTNLSPSSSSPLTIAAWNCNGHLASSGMDTVAMMIQHYHIDIFLLSDTRLDDRSARYKIKQLRKLCAGFSVLSFPTSRASYSRRGGCRMNTMAGSMIIISPRCATNISLILAVILPV